MEQHARVDLDAYFDRIGYGGPREPTLAVLRELHRLHPMAIPFENLDPLLQQPVRLDPDTLRNKLVLGRRGGYCFEQNLMLMGILRSLGFRVSGLAGRVLWMQPEDSPRLPMTHMLLRIDLDAAHGAEGSEPYIADVGFGVAVATAPLRLLPGIEQQTPHGSYRVVEAPAGYKVQARIGGEWKTLYAFEMNERPSVDYEPPNWWVSTHPESHFTYTLMAARPVAEGRIALRNNEFVEHPLGGDSRRRVIAEPEEIADILETRFGIALPDRQKVTGMLKRLLER